MKIQVRHDPTPLDTRSYDWRAVQEGYQQGDRIGWGRTKLQAIRDLLIQLEMDPDTKVSIKEIKT